MNYRFMRVIVFFDLPTETAEDKANYRHFRKALIRNGFLMMQESVYCRLLITPTAERAAIEVVRKHKPPKGLVQVLTVTEKQFARMEYIVGEASSEVVNTDERLIWL